VRLTRWHDIPEIIDEVYKANVSEMVLNNMKAQAERWLVGDGAGRRASLMG